MRLAPDMTESKQRTTVYQMASRSKAKLGPSAQAWTTLESDMPVQAGLWALPSLVIVTVNATDTGQMGMLDALLLASTGMRWTGDCTDSVVESMGRA